MSRGSVAASGVADLTEKQWQSQVVDLGKMLGWRLYHPYDSRRSNPGYPDLTLVRDRIVFLELKTEKGKLSEPQRDWLTALRRAGGEAYVVRPSQLQDLADVLAAKYPVPHRLWSATEIELGGRPGAQKEAAA
jgi:hypothetical protein